MDESNGRLLRTLDAPCDVGALVAHGGHVYAGGSDGGVYRFSEGSPQPPTRFDLGHGSALTSLAIEPAARASWASDGSTARGRPALLLSASFDGDVRAVELPLRGGHGGVGPSQPAVAMCAPDDHPSAAHPKPALRREQPSPAALVAILAPFALPGGLPGAAARALLCGGAAPSVRVHSLRDGNGCGALLGSVAVPSAVSSLAILEEGDALAGLHSGAICLLSAATAGGGWTWSLTAQVAAHSGGVGTIQALLPAPSTPPSTVGSAAEAADRAAGFICTAGASDGLLKVWPRPAVRGMLPADLSRSETHRISTGEAPLCGMQLPTTARSCLLLSADTAGRITCWTACGAQASPDAPGVTPPPAASPSIMGRTAPAYVHRGAPPSMPGRR